MSSYCLYICSYRSIDVVYDSMHYLKEVPQYRFKPPSTLFGYPPENDNNACYCVGVKCPHAGRYRTVIHVRPTFIKCVLLIYIYHVSAVASAMSSMYLWWS